MNSAVISIKGSDVTVAYHPNSGEPHRGDALLLRERAGNTDMGVVVQVIEHHSASYPGDNEASIQELLERGIADRLDLVVGEPGLSELKELKIARCKIRYAWRDGHPWQPWNGHIPTRNVDVLPISAAEVLTNVTG